MMMKFSVLLVLVGLFCAPTVYSNPLQGLSVEPDPQTTCSWSGACENWKCHSFCQCIRARTGSCDRSRPPIGANQCVCKWNNVFEVDSQKTCTLTSNCAATCSPFCRCIGGRGGTCSGCCTCSCY